MKKNILYCSFIVSVLILLLAICLFVIKVDLIRICYFTNNGSSFSLLVDEKTNQFIDNQSNKNCILSIENQKYKAHLVYDQRNDKGYLYWANIDLNEDIPIIESLIKCNFGGEILIKHII